MTGALPRLCTPSRSRCCNANYATVLQDLHELAASMSSDLLALQSLLQMACQLAARGSDVLPAALTCHLQQRWESKQLATHAVARSLASSSCLLLLSLLLQLCDLSLLASASLLSLLSGSLGVCQLGNSLPVKPVAILLDVRKVMPACSQCCQGLSTVSTCQVSASPHHSQSCTALLVLCLCLQPELLLRGASLLQS